MGGRSAPGGTRRDQEAVRRYQENVRRDEEVPGKNQEGIRRCQERKHQEGRARRARRYLEQPGRNQEVLENTRRDEMVPGAHQEKPGSTRSAPGGYQEGA